MPPLAEVEALDVVHALVSHDIAGWGSVDPAQVAIERTEATEWHAVFFVTAPEGSGELEHRMMVVNVPSWSGATLANKAAASVHLAGLGIGPAILGDFAAELPPGSGVVRRVHVCEWLGGGEVLPEELQTSAHIAALGSLYGRLHNSEHTEWFAGTLAGLKQEGLMAEDDAGDWASCSWVLSWLLSLVPETNRVELTEKGVDFDFIRAEIDELRVSSLLPTTPTVTVHGDSHLGNVMHRVAGDCASLRLIDFDLTAPGPAGSEFGFIVLMLFRCGFSQELVLDRELQREFAVGYLGQGSSSQDVEEMLLTMHLWAYFGILKMGLLCAVLMNNEGHEGKRQVMHLRGPVLLHPGFLKAAKRCMAEAQAGPGDMREDLLTRGLFFVAEEAWERTSGAKQ